MRSEMSKWWKCDLQVATPAWEFTHRAVQPHDLRTEAGKDAFADEYIAAVRAQGLEVISLADHNTGEWIDRMVAAGQRGGVTVFPGVEVTSGSGADGVHLLVVGDLAKTSQDFDRLLSSAIGFDEDAHPRFREISGHRVPGS